MRTQTLPLLLLLGLFSCGGSDGDPATSAREALDEGSYQTALDQFDKALEGKTPDDGDFYDLSIDRARALAHVDSAKVPEALKALSEKTKVAARDFRSLTIELVNAADADALTAAVEVINQGMIAYPDDGKMTEVLEKVKARSLESGNTAAQSALTGMGYLGGD